MNNLFRSDWIPPEAGMDNRFIPHKMRHILFFPFYWIERSMVTDGTSTDIRFLYAYSIAGIVAVFYAIRIVRHLLTKHIAKRLPKFVVIPTRSGQENIPDALPLPRDEKSRISFFFFVFIVFSYIIWEYQFSTLRYAIPIESLLGLFVFFCLFAFFRVQNHYQKHIFISSILIFFLLSALITDQHERPRVVFTGGPVIESNVPQLQENALVIAFPMSLALAPSIVEKSPTTIFVSGLFEVPTSGPAKTWRELKVLQDGKIKRLVREKITKHQGPIYVLAHKVFDFADPKINEKCEQHNIKVLLNSAEEIPTNFGIYKLYRTEYNNPKITSPSEK
jgi:hypothetical protein